MKMLLAAICVFGVTSTVSAQVSGAVLAGGASARPAGLVYADFGDRVTVEPWVEVTKTMSAGADVMVYDRHHVGGIAGFDNGGARAGFAAQLGGLHIRLMRHTDHLWQGEVQYDVPASAGWLFRGVWYPSSDHQEAFVGLVRVFHQ